LGCNFPSNSTIKKSPNQIGESDDLNFRMVGNSRTLKGMNPLYTSQQWILTKYFDGGDQSFGPKAPTKKLKPVRNSRDIIPKVCGL